jgi:hypothetical protein
MPDFSNLQRPAKSVERPKTIPAGTFIFTVLGYTTGESAQKKTPKIEFTVRPTQALDDVDEAELAEFGGMEALQRKTMRLIFYTTDDALFRLTDFLVDDLGLDAELDILQLLPEAVHQSFAGNVTHSLVAPQKPGDEPWVRAEIGSTAPAD